MCYQSEFVTTRQSRNLIDSSQSVENKQLEVLKERLQGCLQAGASGSGCKADINWTCVGLLSASTGSS